MLNELGITEKTIDQLINLGLSIVILAVGWIVIKFIIRIARKALDRTSLDPVLYRFILKILRIFASTASGSLHQCGMPGNLFQIPLCLRIQNDEANPLRMKGANRFSKLGMGSADGLQAQPGSFPAGLPAQNLYNF